ASRLFEFWKSEATMSPGLWCGVWMPAWRGPAKGTVNFSSMYPEEVGLSPPRNSPSAQLASTAAAPAPTAQPNRPRRLTLKNPEDSSVLISLNYLPLSLLNLSIHNRMAGKPGSRVGHAAQAFTALGGGRRL